MILIADSGSTKTSWVLSDASKKVVGQCKTSGINPFYQTEEEIYNALIKEFELEISDLKSLYFYGAGCANPEKKDVVLRALRKMWNPHEISVDSDLMCAARSLCGRSPGIAAILGTGSNSCYFNGQDIENQISPLGFILGDEGSGAVLGKKLVADVLKRQLPEHICQAFLESYKLTPAEILDRVYRQPFPNRYLAGFTRFINEHINEESLYVLVKNSFIEFFNRNIMHYKQFGDNRVHFTGSIAWYFIDPLKDAAVETGFSIGKVIMDPMEGLIAYHSEL